MKPTAVWILLRDQVLALVFLMSMNATILCGQNAPERNRSYVTHAMTNAGDAESGRRLFFESKIANCVTCHRVGERGGHVGPDLSKIGGKFDRPHLIESLVAPSAQIVEGYQSSRFLLDDGSVEVGIVKSRDAQRVEMVGADGQPKTIKLTDVELEQAAELSLMPSNLVEQLKPDDVTDLVAYMETLQPGGKPRFGAGVRGKIRVPDGFEVSLVATGLSAAVSMETLADGRLLVCEQPGSLRVIQDDTLLDEPAVELKVESNWERGLIGVTVDPNFAATPWVYLCYVMEKPFTHHRISRMLMRGNRLDPATEEVLLEGDDQSRMGGRVPAGHQGGALHFASDGTLLVGIGEQTAGEPSQKLDTFLGKVLRIERDGRIPDDNPLLHRTTGKYRAIWAFGCRNPFTFAVSPDSGMVLINDVGGKFEEINVGLAGANYGWPTIQHGVMDAEGYETCVHRYPEASISGGAFVPQTASEFWPSEYQGKYLFADFVHGWIRVLDPEKPANGSTDFASGLRRVVDIRFGASGALYVLLRNAWVIDKKFEGGTGSLIKIEPI